MPSIQSMNLSAWIAGGNSGKDFLKNGKVVSRLIGENSEIVKKTLETFALNACPSCRGKLSDKDSAGYRLDKTAYFIEKFCPDEYFIVQFKINPNSNAAYMKIFTNTLHPHLIAESGPLAYYNEINRKKMDFINYGFLKSSKINNS